MPPLSRSLQQLSVLRNPSAQLPRIIPARQVRFVNTEGEELGGVQGSEPPGPQRNPVNWRAGTITAVGVGVSVAVMWRMKAKESK
ncbi:hypothetical protein QBC38DRAFT_488062 [Podospora fimiseda]|uniref:Uncharacterized protein n=1 Tax=Podospora fimiseda TaxID=252190 RepID=A0AAN7GNQ3_9PEZI|nr:hypothetical protein QBC38DRAFT_488062 [Podospora fimiseda]